MLDRSTGELRAPAPAEAIETDGRTIVSLSDVSVTFRHATGARCRADVDGHQEWRLDRNRR